MAYYSHHFDAVITVHETGSYRHTVVYLDKSLHAALALQTSPRPRIEADVCGVVFKGAWQPANNPKRWFLMLPKAQLKSAHLAIGSAVEVAFRFVDDGDVDLPAELQMALTRDAAFRAAWAALTPGKQRGLAYTVASAKKTETRQVRAEQVAAQVLSGLTSKAKR
jgi:Bacteriocin-protection, YdeI or OmpD-Associated